MTVDEKSQVNAYIPAVKYYDIYIIVMKFLLQWYFC